MRVWMIRHGESETNKNRLWTGWLDAPLTEKGEEEAAAVRGIIAGVSFDKIYSSDLSRAKRTAEIAIPECKYEIMAMLREINVGNIAGKELSVIMDENNRPMNKDGYVSFGGESRADFRERIKGFMHFLETSDCENIAVFSHAGVVKTFLDAVLGVELPRKNIRCENCAVAVFEYSDSLWSLHSWINLY